MKYRQTLQGLIIALLVLDTVSQTAAYAKDLPTHQRFIEAHCAGCHGEFLAEAKLNLESLPMPREAPDKAELWQQVVDRLTLGDMPPADSEQPAEADKLAVIKLLRGELEHVRELRKSSAEVVLRRLNRNEFNNAMRDLTGLDLRLGDRFPADVAVDGFDNVGEALTVSPYLMEQYIETVEEWLDTAIVTERPEAVNVKLYEYQGGMGGVDLENYRRPRTFADLSPDEQEVARTKNVKGNYFNGGKVNSYIAKFEWYYINVPHEGRYRFKVLMSGRRSTAEQPMPQIRFVAASGPIGSLTVDCPAGQLGEPKWYEFEAWLPAGVYNFRGEFLNPEPNEVRGRRKKNIDEYVPTFFRVHWVDIRGPLYGSWPPEFTQRLLPPELIDVRDEQASARRVLQRMMRKAWRRPIKSNEVEAMLKLFDAERPHVDSFEQAIQPPLTAILSSPHFLYLVEPQKSESSKRLNDFELASRLSFFIWGSLPDDKLLSLAEKGKLGDETTLSSQLERMLASPKADAFLVNFVGQWLKLRDLGSISPDRRRFPTYNPWLEESMRTETREFVRELINQDLSVLNLIDSDFTILNDELARHYGIEGVEGGQFRRVRLDDDSLRGGVLTQASILTLTADGKETSPIHRGKWILDCFLGTPLPPPPPYVPELEEAEKNSSRELKTIRQKLAAHREAAACAGCHSKMDPLGFALEPFDPVGVFREYKDAKAKSSTEAFGELPNGVEFNGPQEFKEVLLTQRSEVFLRGLTTKLLTYALGRQVGFSDRGEVDAIVKRVKSDDYRMRTLLIEVVTSDAFRSF
ncbi:DUF1592 domain-containing protein [Stratiformator vulcanicus]|nr:DUF1592 domain-containing protein [Stratiformator vulcanicus]